jgi:hypothetical protein
MAKLDDITRGVVSDVDGALGCAVIDLTSGLLLSVSHNIPYFTQSYLEAVAAATVELFRGKNIKSVEAMLSSQRGSPIEKMIQEIQMTTENTFHFMSIIKEKPDAVVALICNKKTNLGMGWSVLRKSLSSIAPLIP